MPFKSIGAILLAGFVLGFSAVPFAQMLNDYPPPEYSPVIARLGGSGTR